MLLNTGALYEVILAFDSTNENLKCDLSNESDWAAILWDAIYCGNCSNFLFIDEICKCEYPIVFAHVYYAVQGFWQFKLVNMLREIHFFPVFSYELNWTKNLPSTWEWLFQITWFASALVKGSERQQTCFLATAWDRSRIVWCCL